MTEPILIYDIKSIPENYGVDANMVMKMFQEQKTVWYDSSSGGRTPIITNLPKENDFKFVDLSTQTINKNDT
jgi:hypothetical protein